MRVLVTGAGGMIGGALVKRLAEDGETVVAVDIKPIEDWLQIHDVTNVGMVDLTFWDECKSVMSNYDEVYDLAADMGGIGHIETHRADCMLSVLNNTHTLLAAQMEGVGRYFYSSSACVYSAGTQNALDLPALRESDAWPAEPEAGYGELKLFHEQLCKYFTEDYGILTRIARYHNCYGIHTTYDGGREKAPAAICRKVAEAVLSGKHEIEIWGDGSAQRSFMWMDDCIEGTIKIMRSDFGDPLNLGSSELVSVNQLVDIVEDIAGVQLERKYDLTAPQGVRGRNSDNTLIREVLGWEPSTPLREGMEKLYYWIYGEMTK